MQRIECPLKIEYRNTNRFTASTKTIPYGRQVTLQRTNCHLKIKNTNTERVTVTAKPISMGKQLTLQSTKCTLQIEYMEVLSELQPPAKTFLEVASKFAKNKVSIESRI